ncbi:MAG: adenylate kinase [Spirochaetota bacterium]
MELIFLGPPGAGKGTMAIKASQEYKIPHISTGDLFRNEIKNQTELGKKVKSILDSGDLVPDEVTLEIVRNRLSRDDAENGFILDGFPRTIPQAEGLSKLQAIKKVISFSLTDEAVIERLSGRRVCKACGKNYHIKFMPPKVSGKCDVCSSELFTRADDKIESIKNRLSVYRKQTEPLIQFYDKQKLLTEIDASPEPGEVFNALKKIIETANRRFI